MKAIEKYFHVELFVSKILEIIMRFLDTNLKLEWCSGTKKLFCKSLNILTDCIILLVEISIK